MFGIKVKTPLKIYIVLTCLLLLDTFLFFRADISFPGTLADRLLFWCWLASTFFILVQYRRLLWTKVYTVLLLVLLFAAALPMGAPLVMLHTFALGKEVSFQAGNIRLSETVKNPFGRPYISVIRSYGLYEQEIATLEPDFEVKGRTYRLEDVLSVKEVTNNVQKELVFVFKTGSVIREIP